MKKILIIAALSFTLLSCKKDFLDLSPKDQNSSATFFRTEAHFRQAVTAAYTPLRDLLVNDYFTSEMRSDNTFYQPYPSNRGTAYIHRENIGDFTDNPTNSYTNAVYFHCYSGIAKANIVIQRLEGAGIPAAAKADIDGQAKFLRAWNYFKLVRLFGAVPLYLQEVTTAEEAFLPRATVEQVYNRIIEDAQDAIEELAPPAGFPQTGLATKGAATMLLAEVYVTQQKYEEAETLLNSLQQMGYDLLPGYADVFSTANKNSRESILEVQYKQGTEAGAQPSNFIYHFLPRSKDTRIITDIGTDNSGTGGWNTPTQDMLEAYEPDDKRKEASIGMAEGTYNASDLFVISANKSVVNYTPAPGKMGVPYIKKYLHPHSTKNNTDDNWPMYRYAHALLLLAESLNEQGKSPQALVPLNKVRARAFGDELHAITTVDKDALRTIIERERRVELAFENHRWHDLVRTGRAVAVMNAHGAALKQQYDYLSPDSYNVTNDRLLFPIPQSERELNPELTQNNGYPQ